MPKAVRVRHADRVKLKRHIVSLTYIAQRVFDLDSKEKIEKAVALLIQVMITATFRPNQKNLFNDD